MPLPSFTQFSNWWNSRLIHSLIETTRIADIIELNWYSINAFQFILSRRKLASRFSGHYCKIWSSLVGLIHGNRLMSKQDTRRPSFGQIVRLLINANSTMIAIMMVTMDPDSPQILHFAIWGCFSIYYTSKWRRIDFSSVTWHLPNWSGSHPNFFIVGILHSPDNIPRQRCIFWHFCTRLVICLRRFQNLNENLDVAPV